MTSPVDTSVKYFSSAMAGAPALSGTAGSLVGLLDACLKDGFDTKALTSLVAAGGVMTATFSGTHSAQTDAVVLVSGVTGGPSGFAGANGEQKITGRPTATTATWATSLPDGAYTGTMTMKMAPLGWLKPFAGTNKGAYKSSDPSSTGCVLRVDDAGTTSCRVVGYVSMSDIDTGLEPFPSALQQSGGGYWPKSTNANATAVAWTLIGDSKMFYLSLLPASANASQQNGTLRGFGDPVALKPSGDAYFCTLSYSSTSTVASMNDGDYSRGDTSQIATPRAFTGVGSSALHYSQPYIGTSSNPSGTTATLGAFPGSVDGSLYLCKRVLCPAGQNYPRGELPGVLHVPQSFIYDNIKQWDKVPGTGAYAGRTLMAVTGSAAAGFTSASSNTSTATVMFDITGPWR